ncbi:MAG: histidine kinase, partial [Gemmatimonadetes bacterium]|nr:histidine kinase [Gemmatimonadota bacterium]
LSYMAVESINGTSLIERGLSLAASVCWVIAASRVFERYARLLLVIALSFAGLAMWSLRGPAGMSLPGWLDVLVVLFEAFAIGCLYKIYDRLIAATQLPLKPLGWPVSHWRHAEFIRLLPIGLILYGVIQPIGLIISSDMPGLARVGLSIGYFGGLVAKILIATGLFSLFLASSQSLNVERGKLEHTRNILGRLSHEAGTPLAEIGVTLRLVFAALRNKTPMQPHLYEIEGVLHRLHVIITAAEAEVLESNLPSPLPVAPMPLPHRIANLNVLAERALASVKYARVAEASITDWIVRYSGKCCISCNSAEIIQIIGNLLRNALDALAANPPDLDREVIVTTRAVRQSDGNSQIVELSVLDNGEGVADRVRDTMFSLGVSTRGRGNRGHGLAIVTELLRVNGGSVSVTSPAWPIATPTRGTRFTIQFAKTSCKEQS